MTMKVPTWLKRSASSASARPATQRGESAAGSVAAAAVTQTMTPRPSMDAKRSGSSGWFLSRSKRSASAAVSRSGLLTPTDAGPGRAEPQLGYPMEYSYSPVPPPLPLAPPDASESDFVPDEFPGKTFPIPTRKRRGSETASRLTIESELSRPLLACPYLKHIPATCGASFRSIDGLKEHLYRAHRQKPNCPRCRQIFPAERDVKEHMKSKMPCEAAADAVVDGFDDAQEEELKSKKRGRGVESDEDRWREIYRILFPDCTEMPDMYYKPYFDEPPTPARNEFFSEEGHRAAAADDADLLSIFTRDDPCRLEEAFLPTGEAVAQGLAGKKKRRRLATAVRGFATKMLRQPSSGTTAASKHHPNNKSSDSLGRGTIAPSPSPEPDLKPRMTTETLDIGELDFGEDLDFGFWAGWEEDEMLTNYDWVGSGGAGKKRPLSLGFGGKRGSVYTQRSGAFGVRGGSVKTGSGRAFLSSY